MDAIGTVAALELASRDLGPYELLRILDSSPMATVYLARHRGEDGFERPCALEVLHPHLATDQQLVSTWLDDTRIAARLRHPNVIPILDVGSHDGVHYVVLEYVEGVTLSKLLSKFGEQRPAPVLVNILLDVLAGLHAAHTLTDDDGTPMGLVHRDVSPHNVMVGADGTARVMRLGTGRAESRRMSARPGQLKEEIAFMSPEQIRGADNIDRRSDVFSSAATLWKALTGRPLFLADSDAATLHNILHLRIPPASTIGCKPPSELDAVLERGLARNPATRFQSARELEDALRDAATRAACIGTPVEVAAWVNAGFGDELAERRALETAISDAPVPAESGTDAVATAMDVPQRSKRMRTGLLVGCGGVSLLVLLAVVALKSPTGAGSRANAAEQPRTTSVAVRQLKPPSTAAKPPETASSPKLVEAEAPGAPAAQQNARARGSSRRSTAPAPERANAKAESSPEPAAPATASAPGAFKQAERWNSDSPLPPE